MCPNLHHGGLQVRIHPLVRDIPSNRAELTPLKDQSVEKHKGEAKLLESSWARTRLVLFFLQMFERKGGLNRFGPQ